MADERNRRGSRSEDEGIPDLQEGTPGQQWAGDPQEAPLPGEVAQGAREWGTTVEEQREGEPLDLRLSREQADDVGASAAGETPANLYEPTRDHAGRLVAPDEGTRGDEEPDLTAADVGADSSGYTAEEDAVRVAREPEPGDEPQ